jgi:hypothetical protein
VLEGEGDDRYGNDDLTRRAVTSLSKQLDAGTTSFDLTGAVRNALARGDTRLTVRVENLDGAQPVTLQLAGGFSKGKTGLSVEPKTKGLVADLYTEDGQLVATGRSIVDMRALEAGGYLLRVYNPVGPVATDTGFKVEVAAPIWGYSHPNTDRDVILGGEGDDFVIGNSMLDRLSGESGRDRFIGESLEIRDFDQGREIRQDVALDERSDEPLTPYVDALIAIEDAGLRAAIAEALGLPVTKRYDGQVLVHVPEGSQRTDIRAVFGADWRQRILASDLAEIAALDASSRGIVSLKGLEFATSLQSLNLANNNILRGELDRLEDRKFGALSSDDVGLDPNPTDTNYLGVYRDALNFKAGLQQLEHLALDFNESLQRMSSGIPNEFAALARMPELRSLSFDGTAPTDLEEFAALRWQTPNGGTRSLEFLSIDNYQTRGLTAQYWLESAKLGGGNNSITTVNELNDVVFGRPAFDSSNQVLTRVESTVDYAPGSADFAGISVLDDRFFGRWTGRIWIGEAGAVTFHTTSDDGSRLFIDGSLVVDNDGLHGFATQSGTVTLSQGWHGIQLDFFEQTGAAGVRLEYDPVNGPRQVIPEGDRCSGVSSRRPHRPARAEPAQSHRHRRASVHQARGTGSAAARWQCHPQHRGVCRPAHHRRWRSHHHRHRCQRGQRVPGARLGPQSPARRGHVRERLPLRERCGRDQRRHLDLRRSGTRALSRGGHLAGSAVAQ